MEQQLLSIKEAAKLLEVCENTLRDWDESGKLKATRTSGNHRRYPLNQIRDYLEKNPLIEQKIPEGKFPEHVTTLEKWLNHPKFSEYMIGAEDQNNLAILLDNALTHYEFNSNNPLFTDSQMLYLTSQAWNKVKLKKVVSIQPINICSLIFYKVSDDKGVRIESDAVYAKSYKYDFGFFNSVKFEDFDKVKDIYTSAIAQNIDNMICELLPRINLESILDACTITPLFQLKHFYDYIVAPRRYIERFSKHSEGVDLYECQEILYPESFMPKGFGGKYPQSHLDLPIFAPNLLLTLAPTTGTTCSGLFRGAFYKG